MKTKNNGYILKTILLSVIFMVFLYSCEKNNETSNENNNGQLFERESSDNSEDNEDKLFSDDSGELYQPIVPGWPRTPGLPYDDSEFFLDYALFELLYKYNGYWSMRFGEYFELDDNIHNPPELKGHGGFSNI